MKPELTIIPKLTIHPTKITLYNEYHWNPSRPPKKQSPWESNTFINKDGEIEEKIKRPNKNFIESKRTSGGILSKNSIKKLNKATEYLILLSNNKTVNSNTTGRKLTKKISFITLTLSSEQKHPDNEIKEKLLNQFLIEL